MGETATHGKVTRLASSNCLLGEGPLWLLEHQQLVFVDIIAKRLLRWSQKKGLSEVALSRRVGSVAHGENGRLLAASERGLFALDPESGEMSSIGHDQIIGPDNLMNDGKCDRQGRFVFGSKSLNETDSSGRLMSFNGKTVRRWQSGMVMNGPAFSPDGKTIYFADSPTRKIFCAPYDTKTGDLGAAEVFVTLAEDAGYPDGMSVDATGHLWNAHWDGWRISRYAPDGTLVEEIEMPVSRPTSLAFGGADMKTLFITSARTGRAEEAANPEPAAGDLFVMETDITGLAEPDFRGSL